VAEQGTTVELRQVTTVELHFCFATTVEHIHRGRPASNNNQNQLNRVSYAHRKFGWVASGYTGRVRLDDYVLIKTHDS